MNDYLNTACPKPQLKDRLATMVWVFVANVSTSSTPFSRRSLTHWFTLNRSVSDLAAHSASAAAHQHLNSHSKLPERLKDNAWGRTQATLFRNGEAILEHIQLDGDRAHAPHFNPLRVLQAYDQKSGRLIHSFSLQTKPL